MKETAKILSSEVRITAKEFRDLAEILEMEKVEMAIDADKGVIQIEVVDGKSGIIFPICEFLTTKPI